MKTTIEQNGTETAARHRNGRNGVPIHVKTELRVIGAPPRDPEPGGTPLELPMPPFPRQPENLGDVEPDPKFLPRDGNPCRRA